ncbi:hypothetical protein [Pseudoxanthomonas sp. SE1]|uniref:hypothetical protein n=1 Tax=Pseudoxanthomonas sp. SE1 TaxID=1664560 RepID=UPI00240DE48A|nr:hypothetical protein [Pseudoxanthomonas sp. SE1]WFC43183.1 hypothetical protein OY559_06650 [Pseudoxanthomonas sp. SE1]
MGTKSVLLCVALALAGCAVSEEERFQDQAQRDIRASLKDPKSAEFRNLSVNPGLSGVRVVCGEVNSRNSFGGYTGFRPFVYWPGELAISQGDGDRFVNEAILGICTGDETLLKRQPAIAQLLAKAKK